jgi:pimeloyl-ACP methyl ester carboxylesterase
MPSITRFLAIAIFASSAILVGSHTYGAYGAYGANVARGAFAARSLASESRYAKVDGQRVHYENHGKGREALVFVHGWTCTLNFWSRQVSSFDAMTRVIAIDLPGHGLSDKPEVAYTMDLFARAVDAVLLDAGVDRAVLVGHSMGGPVIRQFYRKYPQKTLALVVVDGPLRSFGKKEDMERFIAPLRGPGYKEFADKFIDNMFGPNASPELRAEIKPPMLSTPQHVAVSAMEGMLDPAIWGDDKINVPVLAVMTKNWPPDTEQFYRSLAPNLDYRTMDGVGHFLMMEKPKEFNEALSGFLVKSGLLKK